MVVVMVLVVVVVVVTMPPEAMKASCEKNIKSADPGACGGDLGVFCYKRVPLGSWSPRAAGGYGGGELRTMTPP